MTNSNAPIRYEDVSNFRAAIDSEITVVDGDKTFTAIGLNALKTTGKPLPDIDIVLADAMTDI